METIFWDGSEQNPESLANFKMPVKSSYRWKLIHDRLINQANSKVVFCIAYPEKFYQLT
jgi:hypothetical protein